jgi:hypothetical protein
MSDFDVDGLEAKNQENIIDPVDKLIAIRKATGASVEQFAHLVGFAGPNAADNYRQLERGKRPLAGPLLPLLECMEPGVDIDTLRAAVAHQLPAFVDMAPLGEEVDFEGVLHTRYPRFIGAFTGLMPDALRARVESAAYASVPAPADTELGQMVAIPLDPYIGDLTPLLREAARLKFGACRNETHQEP